MRLIFAALLFFSFLVEKAVTKNVKLGAVFPEFLLINQEYNLKVSGNGFTSSDSATLQFSLGYSNQISPIKNFMSSFQNTATVILMNISFNSSGMVLLASRWCKTPLNLLIYERPIFRNFNPNVSHVTGGDLVVMTGSGFFLSNYILVVFNYDDITITVPGTYDTALDCITFTAPQFAVPPSIDRNTLQVNEIASFSPSISYTLDGVQYFSTSPHFKVKVTPVFKVGYIFHSPITDFGWTYIQNLARLSIDTSYSGSVTSSYVEYVPEEWDPVMKVTMQYCYNNYDLIFGGSNGFLPAMANASYSDACNYYTANGTVYKNVPKVTHMIQATSGLFHTPSLLTVFGRVFQMRYLSGLVAGIHLKKISSDNVGYIAAFDFPEVRRGINAFVIGCRKTNPNCRVIIAWVSTWGNAYIEEQAAQYLWFHEGCRIITQHSDTTSPQIVFANGGPSASSLQAFQDANGLTSSQMENFTTGLPNKGCGIGYNSDMRQLVGDSVLTSAMLRWEPIIDFFIQHLINSEWPHLDTYWPGADVGADELADFSPLVDTRTRQLVQSELDKFMKGESTVFCGSLLMEDGQPVPARQPNYTNVQGKNMYNFVSKITNAPCERQTIDAGECCLNDFPGMLDMWYQLEGCYTAKQCLDPAKCIFGTMVHTLDEGGHTEAWYTPPPVNPPRQPQLLILCRAGVAQEYNSFLFEFMGYVSEGGSDIQAYRVEWDTNKSFGSLNRGCSQGLLCKDLMPSQPSICKTALLNGDNACLYGTINGLQSGTTYFVRVFAFDGVSYSVPSNTDSCQTKILRTLDKVSQWIELVFVILCCVGVILGFANCVFLCKHRHEEVIAARSYRFCILVSIGLMLGYAVILAFVGVPTESTCSARPCAIVIAYTIVFSPLFAKTRRLDRILNNKSLNNLKISDLKLLKEVLANLCVDAIGLALMDKFQPLLLLDQDASYSNYLYTRSCGNPSSKINMFVVFFLFYKLGLMVYGAYLSVQVRNAPSKFNESKHIAICIYNVSLTAVILVPLMFLVQKPNLVFVLQGMAIVWICTASLFALFAPIWQSVIYPDVSYLTQTGISPKPKSKHEPVEAFANKKHSRKVHILNDSDSDCDLENLLGKLKPARFGKIKAQRSQSV